MSFIIGMLIIGILGGIIAQDAIASMAFYNGREGRKNQAFRVVRLVVGVLIIVVVFHLVGGE